MVADFHACPGSAADLREATVMPRSRWLFRGVALLAAVCLTGEASLPPYL